MQFLVISTICLAFSFGLIKKELATLSPDFIVFVRLMFATIIFLPFFVKLKSFSPKTIIKVALIGVVQFGLMYMCFIRAFHYLNGNEIALLTTSTPILVAICSTFFGKKFKFAYILCIALSILGALFIVWQSVPYNFIVKGILFMEASNFSFALGQVLWKELVKENDLGLIALAYAAASVFVIPFFIFNFDGFFEISTSQWLSLLYLGIVPTGIGFFLWNKGAKAVSNSTLAIMNNLKIPVGVLFSILIFHEKVELESFLIGSFIILLAIIWSYFLLDNKKN